MGSTRDDVGCASFERGSEALRPLGQFNASDADALVKGYASAKEGEAKVYFEGLLRQIEGAAKKGKRNLTYGAQPLHFEMLVKNLKDRGFKARIVSEQRDGNFIDIDW